jgi:hypothetical protein
LRPLPRCTFNQAARLQDFHWSFAVVIRGTILRWPGPAAHIDTGAHADLNVSFDLEQDKRFTNSRSRDRKAVCKLVFGRKPGALLQFARFYERTDLLLDLAVKPARLQSQEHGNPASASLP